MGKKIAFIGAGSLGFTRGLVNDILTYSAFEDCTLALMDINPERLEFAKQAVTKLVESSGLPVTVQATTNRAEALEGAHGVICTILSGGIDIWRNDIEIPKRYGVDTCVGDTRGPSGIFRFLRTAPVMLDICADIAKYADPNVVFLNYSNPMAMLCRIMQGEFPKMCITGLCHSVQGTLGQMAKWIDADPADVTATCAGINHTAFYIDFKYKGQDAYPLLRKAVAENPDIYNNEQVRMELFLALDYFITESSGHNSEYCAWFRKRPDLIEKYCTHGTGWNPGKYAFVLEEYLKREDTWKADTEAYLNGEIAVKPRGHEYAAYIFNAVFGDHEMFTFNGNVRNFGIISNLPQGACVEVPCLADANGVTPMQVGAMPGHLALMCNTSSQIEELAVEAALTGNPKLVYQAICFDPLTSAVLGLREIKDMVNDMFDASRDYLPQFAKPEGKFLS